MGTRCHRKVETLSDGGGALQNKTVVTTVEMVLYPAGKVEQATSLARDAAKQQVNERAHGIGPAALGLAHTPLFLL